ncbi:putative non-specific serine/threonine protein kinase [Helianthus annuus]|uniref:Putative leucine-rich repeat protein, plant-type n=1 Tax=Helianthus annuus TaxID=4232 RepID=A0A251SI75_HELAN|nr:phytosulfokine receptor 1 [Helianthus annuus]KAJ0560095.1 putative non-specific serine/threonine protein kinase [Helianthus annuus]KAJ0566325.1 putative non-specific serine/threonine protein kinase [Helianthus annuus]KAJ0573089.1 putative non-specific serine/threonine protein kinase [Helianthus annuus]KAJ0740391.1 putative non-specific serine/threonine protein kinase [Helianthus annuus]
MVVALRLWVFVLISIQTQLLVISQNPTCNPNDLRGLTGFMNALYSPIDGWWPANSSSSYCCNWIGVTCNSSSGRIVKLQLPDQISGGRISTSVSYLDQLTTLDLSHNFLSGPLPVPLFHLTHLKELNLSGNEFNRVLPVSINLPALQVLDISDNNLRGFLPFGLCVNSSRIRVLDFASNYFTGIIPPQVGNCTFLEHLSVASNFISGIIPDFLLGLPRLYKLAFQDNEFTGIGNSSSPLVHLDISSNRFSGNIPDVFHNFLSLSRFVSHSNNLSGGVPPSLSNSQTISFLNLRNNSLDGPIDFNCLKMVNLASLDLSNNNFSGTIPDNLASCRELKALNFSSNKLMTGPIPESFKNFESLSYLSLASCSFSNLSSTLEVLQHSPNLTILVLTMNFYGEQLPSDSNLQFKTLKALVISNCGLTGSLPSWLNSLTQLQLLDLSSNHLTGSIPAKFGDFLSLFYLDLSNNSFSGEIPKNLTELQSLISLEDDLAPDLMNYNSRNLIWLTLQDYHIRMFPQLLDLSSNVLTGPIWPEFGNLKKLVVLDLKHNNLSGSIPDSLSALRNLQTLDLSYNSLTGTIPSSFMVLLMLSKFSVAYNNLTGVIPSGSQLSTFADASFEGNPGLCHQDSLKYCERPQVLLETPAASNEEEHSVTRLLAFVGFGTGFFVTVFYMLVVPVLTSYKTHS